MIKWIRRHHAETSGTYDGRESGMSSTVEEVLYRLSRRRHSGGSMPIAVGVCLILIGECLWYPLRGGMP
jgi:hypothetical protein